MYAVATVKFPDYAFKPSSKKPDIIIRALENTTYEGKAKIRPSATPDLPYLPSSQGAFSGMDIEDDTKVRLADLVLWLQR